MDVGTDRREFLKRLAAGAAVVGSGVGGLALAGCEAGARDVGGSPESLRDLPPDDPRWHEVRNEFLLEPGYAYMNTAGLGPSPRSVVMAQQEAWERLERRCETGHGERAGIRTKAAAFLGCAEDELAFTRSATESMNLVARGLELKAGDQVLMTTHEHPGGAMPWFGVQEDVAIRVATFEPGSGGDDTLNRFEAALTANTRLVMVSHVTCTTGLVLPVEEMAGLCRDRGIILVLDGAQAPGQIPVDLNELRCDFYVASGHKFLTGPKGTGFLYVRDEWLDRWKPSYVGAYSDTGFDLASGGVERVRPASGSEYGTRNTPLLVGFGAAFDFLSGLGLDAVVARGAYLATMMREGLEPLSGVEIITPPDAAAAILSFLLPESGGTPWDWCNRLRVDHGLRLRPVSEAGLMAVRASTHVFNTEDEVQRLVDVLGSLV
jgi:selenocysteine lyase/cysteine desulfurase